MLATTKIAMNSARPPNDAVTAISVVRAVWSFGILGPAARVPGEHHRAASGGAQPRGVEAGGCEHPDRVDASGMAGQPRGLRVGEEDRRLPPDEVAEASHADHGHGAGGFGGREAQPGAERRGVAGDGFVGSDRRASGAEKVRRQRRAAPPVGDRGPAAEADRRRHVADYGPDARDGRQPSDEPGARAGAFTQRDVVVGADDLLSAHHGRGGGVTLDGRMAPQGGFEHHAAGHDEHGRREQRQKGAGEHAEAAAGTEDGETQHGSALQMRQVFGDLVGAGSLEHPGEPSVGEQDDAVGVRGGLWVMGDHHDGVAIRVHDLA